MSTWVEMKYRTPDDEEIDHGKYDAANRDCRFILNCEMPADEQEVLLTLVRIAVDGKKYRYVAQDTNHIVDDHCELEEHRWENVIAWMPLPEPFNEDTAEAPSITKEEVLSIAKERGCDQAYNILLLYGADSFKGKYHEYKELLDKLEVQK